MISKNEAIKTSLFKREIGLFPPVLALLVTTSLTGYVTYLLNSHQVWIQWTFLAHTLLGLAIALIVLPYTFFHFRRTLGVRRALTHISGIIFLLIIIILSLSGIHITVFGQSEPKRWIYELHIWASYLTVILLLFHFSAYSGKKIKGGKGDTHFKSKQLKVTLQYTIVTLVSILILSTIYSSLPSIYKQTPAVSSYEYPYGNHPFRPSQTETASGTFVDVKQIANSKNCGNCHVDIFNEWKESLHGQAASDQTYIRNVSLLARKKGIAATRYCEGCHALVALLTGELSKGGKHGGIKNTVQNIEGISCMGCHGIDRAVHLKGVASYQFSPASDYLFANYDNAFALKVHDFLVRLNPREHRRTMARPILSTPQECATCHVQYMDKDMNGVGWVKMQDEYSAWLNSHYSGQSSQTFKQENSLDCIDCHMPLVPTSDPSANQEGKTISHRTVAANSAIPYLNGDTKQFDLTKRFLQAKKISLDIEEPWRKDAVRTGVFVDETIRAPAETPYFAYLGEKINLKVSVSNLGVGHNFPGGTTDINQVWIYLRATDASNKTIYESGELNDNNEVDKNAYFYHAIAIDQHGQHVWKHDLFNMVGDSYQAIIKPGGADVIEYSFDVPYWAKGPITVTAIARYRKFNQKYARWAFKNNNIDLPIIDMARDVITIPIVIRKAVYQ